MFEMTFIFLRMEEYKENTIYTLIKVVAGIITFISWPHHIRAERYCHFSITIDTKATIHDTE